VIFLLLIPFKNGDTPEYQRDDDTSEDSKQNPNKEAWTANLILNFDDILSLLLQ